MILSGQSWNEANLSEHPPIRPLAQLTDEVRMKPSEATR